MSEKYYGKPGSKSAELYQLLDEGFFHGEVFDAKFTDKKGKVDLAGLEKMWENWGYRKYAMQYYFTYGKLASPWPNPGKEELERIHKECLDKGVTWEELIGYEEDTDRVL